MINQKEKSPSVLNKLKNNASSPRRLREHPFVTNLEVKYKGNRSLSKQSPATGMSTEFSTDSKKKSLRADNTNGAKFTINNDDNVLEDSSENSSYTESYNSSSDEHMKATTGFDLQGRKDSVIRMARKSKTKNYSKIEMSPNGRRNVRASKKNDKNYLSMTKFDEKRNNFKKLNGLKKELLNSKKPTLGNKPLVRALKKSKGRNSPRKVFEHKKTKQHRTKEADTPHHRPKRKTETNMKSYKASEKKIESKYRYSERLEFSDSGLTDYITAQQDKLFKGFDKQAEMIRATQNKRMKLLKNQKKNMISSSSKRSDYILLKNTQNLLNRRNKKIENMERRKKEREKEREKEKENNQKKKKKKRSEKKRSSVAANGLEPKKNKFKKKSNEINLSKKKLHNTTTNDNSDMDSSRVPHTPSNREIRESEKQGGGRKKREKKKKCYQFNDKFKIINFLENDKQLTDKREEFREKMRALKHATYKDNKEDNMKEKQLEGYTIKNTIGVGSYAVVKLAIHKETGTEYAIKFYDRIKMLDPIRMKNYRAEVENLMDLDHTNIMKLHAALEGQRKYIMIMEYIGHASLYEVLERQKGKKLTEQLARIIFYQIFQALRYTHSKNIVHRDIKLQNIIVSDKNLVKVSNSFLTVQKVVDFGFSAKVEPGKRMKIFCGTPSYMGPEIVKRIPYLASQADVWALGVCLYKCVSGNFPFTGINENDLYTKIKKGLKSIPDFFSKSLKDLVVGLMTVDPEKRLTVDEALKCSWFHDVSLHDLSNKSTSTSY